MSAPLIAILAADQGLAQALDLALAKLRPALLRGAAPWEPPPAAEAKAETAAGLPLLEKSRCDQCKRCLQQCPVEAWSLDQRGLPQLDPTRCRRCGICMGSCPLAAISLPGYAIGAYAAAIEALADSAAWAGPEPLILAFLCRHGAWRAARQAAGQGLALPRGLVMLPLPCLGALNNALVADALSLGVDGVLAVGCAQGQCRQRTGSALAGRRAGDLQGKLRQMRLEPQRLRLEALGDQQAGGLAQIAHDFASQLRALGPNPFRI